MRSSSPLARAIAILLFVLLAAVLVECDQPGAGTTPTSAPAGASVPPAWKLVWSGSYSTHIQPIFDQRCVSCHGPARADAELRLDSYAEVMKGGKDGPVVISGSPGTSILISVVETAEGSSRMPPAGPRLNGTEIQNLEIWISAGAPPDGGSGRPAATQPPPATKAAAPGAAAGDAAAGQQAIAKYRCEGCHTIPGIQGANGTAGPSLAGFAKRSVIASTSVSNTAENLAKWIVDPKSIKPGTTMPTLGVTQTDAQSIAAYLRTLQ